MPETTLEPIAPDEAVRLYLRDRQNELGEASDDAVSDHRGTVTRRSLLATG